MSNLKKIFMGVSALIVAAIIAIIITLNNINSNVHINYSTPLYVNIYNRSTVAIDSKNYKDEDGGYDNILSRIEDVTNLTAFEKLINRVSLDKKFIQDSENRYTKWTTDIKNKNVVIEFTYDKEQDVVVYKNGHSRVISYWCLALVIPNTEGFTELIAYYSNTNESTGSAKDDSYAKCEPFVMYGDFSELNKYIKSIK